MPEEIDTFRDAGIERTLTKPIDRSRLRAMLAELTAASAASLMASEPVQDDEQEAELLDAEGLAGLSETLGSARFQELLDRFSADAVTLEGLLQADPSDLEAQGLISEVHKVAGAAGMLGLPLLHRLLVDREARFKASGQSPDQEERHRVISASQNTRSEIAELFETS